jgi:iron complex transport system ATP-binding protein
MILRFDAVSVQYPRAATFAVEQVTFAAPAGTLTALVGPNGSGKSTLVRALLKRVPLANGSVLIDDADTRTLTPQALAQRVAVVPQREETTFAMSVHDFVGLGRHPHRSRWAGWSDADETAVHDALRRSEADTLATRSTDTLSGGEWQRVRIARALAQSEPIVVLDEPTTFLDVAHEMATFELLAALAEQGHAVLAVSHQLNLVARFAQHVVLLDDGRVVAQGAPDEVMQGAVLERVYRWPLVVTRDPAVGAPMLLPLRRKRK